MCTINPFLSARAYVCVCNYNYQPLKWDCPPIVSGDGSHHRTIGDQLHNTIFNQVQQSCGIYLKKIKDKIYQCIFSRCVLFNFVSKEKSSSLCHRITIAIETLYSISMFKKFPWRLLKQDIESYFLIYKRTFSLNVAFQCGDF
jgi:hypothetical protein